MLTSSILFSLCKPSVVPPNLPNKDIGIISHIVEPVPRLSTHYKKSSANPNCLAVSATHIFVAQADKAVVQVYDRDKGTKEADVPFGERITSCCFVGFDDGSGLGVLVLGLRDGRLILWETCTGRQVSTPPAHLEDVDCLAVDTTRNFLLSGSKDHNIHVWKLAELMSFTSDSRAPYKTFSDHRAAITALAIGHSYLSGDFVLSASEDKTVLLWNYRDATLLVTFLVSSVPKCLVLDPADRAFYIGSEESVQFVDLSRVPINAVNEAVELGEKNKWKDEQSLICLAISVDGTQLFTGHKNGQVFKRATPKGQPTLLYDAHLPVSNIIVPDLKGFLYEQPLATRPFIVKPKPDLAIKNDSSMIPERYELNVIFTSMLPSDEDTVDDLFSSFDALLEHSTFPDELLSASLTNNVNKSKGSEPDVATAEELQRLRSENKSATSHINSLTAELERLQKTELARKQSKKLRRLKRIKAFEAMRKKTMGEINGDMDVDENLDAEEASSDTEDD